MATPYQFQCDYIAGCTPQIMDALLRHNLTEVPGYCEDMFCMEAEAKIREACKCPDAGVFFFAGGTICNLSLISAVLRPCGTKRPHCRTRNGSHRSHRPQGA